MKKFIALLAGALTGFGVVMAADVVITPEQISAGVGDPMVFARNLGFLDAADAKAQLESIADAVKTSTAGVKIAYATAQTVVYGKENPQATYADLLAQHTANFAALGLGEPKGSDRITFVIGWYNGDQFDKVRCQAAYEANKELKTLNMGTLCAALGMDFETVVIPCYEGEVAGRNLLFNLFGNNGNWERSAKYFWPLLTAGELNIDWGKQKYAQIIAYEIGKEGFNAAELKAKLTRGILVYKAKARTFKAKEGESNPFIEFVGMMQDTVKDL